MVLKMASPWLDSISGVWYLRVRTPRTMLKAKGQSVTLPIGGVMVAVKVGGLVKVSLRTREPREAKHRFVEANAALQAHWQAVERGPQKLTLKQVNALSGDVYRLWANAFADDPVSPEFWQRVLDVCQEAEDGEYDLAKLMIDPQSKRAWTMNAQFGPMADAVLSRHGLIVDADSRKLVMKEAMRALAQAARLNLRRAGGDWREDTDADRFAKLDRPSASRNAFTMSDMFDAWEKEAVRLNRAAATVRAYRSVFAAFRTFIGNDDAKAVTAEDVIRYKNDLFDKGLQAKTIKDKHIAAMNSVFGHAFENKRLPANPVLGIKVRAAKRTVTREKGFTDEEALVILKAALAYQRAGRESVHFALAKRWLPWLCAFTGARINDLTSLKRDSFRLDDLDDAHLRIQDEKTGMYRDIPLHPQLKDIGLFEFVRQADAGPLFYDAKTDEGQGPQTQGKRLSKWVRELGIPSDVQPNHGWRHRFTTLARRHGLDHEKREYIIGHALPGLGDTYGDMAGLRREIEKLPFYKV